MAPPLSNKLATAGLDAPANVLILKVQLVVSCRAFRKTRDCKGACACSSHGSRCKVDSSRQ